ncbi:SubName: Full=Uncharacterized protein {ECO:0000313/EMBL:CCA71421.1} [Serendipita indica DSM 11827]|uniref:F-box domain-containing protein n=1 Tax=Serendipita indica (strain DSM 11827) TaxID=1109443 RepID=G4TJC3_SERID|nr:SubName: Full=Uncharacterized protein {ECO:0000313/EMBL:CCA71421.1} [Serendipita indica DSM 11827]CCA71421.1 hypothetical protein PIIN_05361 [Serendipita indica DSM 11827]
MPARSSASRPSVAAKIPSEVWTEIFREATRYNGIDELELDPGEIPFDGQLRPPLPDPVLQQTILSTRRSIISVCRRWYDVGIRHLWSHLVIWRTASFVDSPLVPSSMIESCKRKPNLAKHVKKLSIMYTEGWRPPAAVDIGASEEQGMEFIATLPNLVSLRVDQRLLSRISDLQSPPKLRNTYFYSKESPRNEAIVLKSLSQWRQIHSLDIQCRDSPLVVEEEQKLPKLRTLRVQTLNTFSVSHIALGMELPALQNLSIRGWSRVVLGVRKLPNSACQTLESLELIDSFEDRYSTRYWRPRDVTELSRLHTLQVSLPAPIPFSSLKCPNLRTLGIHQPVPRVPDTVSMQLTKEINAALEHFPKLCDIQIHHNQLNGEVNVWNLLSSKNIDERYLEGWKERGASVTFIPPLLPAGHPHDRLILNLQSKEEYHDAHIVYEFTADAFSFSPDNCFARCKVNDRSSKWTESVRNREEGLKKAALAMIALLETDAKTPPRLESSAD